MSYKMKYTKSPFPFKKLDAVGSQKSSQNLKIQPFTTKRIKFTGADTSSKLQDVGEDVSKIQSHLTKKHTLYKRKGLTLKGQVDAPKLDLGWDPKGSMTTFGGPVFKYTKPKARLLGSYKIGKKTTLSGGVEYASGKKPYYTAGLKINL